MDITTNAEILYDQGFTCNKCGHEFSKEELQTIIENVGHEPFNGTVEECSNPECDAEYSFNLRIHITDL